MTKATTSPSDDYAFVSNLRSARQRVGMDTRSVTVTSCAVIRPDAITCRAHCASASLIFRSRPRCLPRAFAAAMPARVRSLIRARSNSANAPITWKSSLPLAVVVSIASETDRKPIPSAWSLLVISMRCAKLRPSRSSFHVTRISPGARAASASLSADRSTAAPLMPSS